MRLRVGTPKKAYHCQAVALDIAKLRGTLAISCSIVGAILAVALEKAPNLLT